MSYYNNMFKTPHCHPTPKEKKIYKEVCSCDKLYLDKCKPDLKEVVESFIKVVIKGYKIIKTHCGSKIVIKGHKIIKIHYVSKDKCGSLKSECFIIPFCEFILVECDEVTVCGIKTEVECFEVEKCNPRSLIACSLFEICAQVNVLVHEEEKVEDCDDDWCQHENNSSCIDYDNKECEIKFKNDEIECNIKNSNDFNFDAKGSNCNDGWFPLNS